VLVDVQILGSVDSKLEKKTGRAKLDNLPPQKILFQEANGHYGHQDLSFHIDPNPIRRGHRQQSFSRKHSTNVGPLAQDIEQTVTVLFQKKQGGMGDWPTFTSPLLRNIMTTHTWYIS
jgi:hypothetical protein